MPADYRFSFGPWNIHEGADPFGPPVRPTVEFAEKLKLYKQLGFDGVQFHDDDAVPDIDARTPQQIKAEAGDMKKLLDGEDQRGRSATVRPRRRRGHVGCQRHSCTATEACRATG